VVVTKVDLVKDGPADIREWAALLSVDPADIFLMRSYATATELDEPAVCKSCSPSVRIVPLYLLTLLDAFFGLFVLILFQ